MARRVPQQPTTQQVLDAFGGRFYAPADATFKASRQVGWGRDADREIDYLSIGFEKPGRRRERIIVEVSQTPRTLEVILFFLAVDLTAYATPRFPITIERSRVGIAVDGRERSFTSYSGASATVAVTRIGGYGVLIRCRSSRLKALKLVPVDRSQLAHALQN